MTELIGADKVSDILRSHAAWVVGSGGVRANLSGANLRGADLCGANLYGADLSRADLYRANLSMANLYGADLSEANLCWADLSEAELCGANLREANLSGASLFRADLSGANLCWANLSKANLSKANLSMANLSEANLWGKKPLLADTTRNYVLYAIEAKEPYFVAGCRCFTMAEAITHWSNVRPQPSYVEAINAYMLGRGS